MARAITEAGGIVTRGYQSIFCYVRFVPTSKSEISELPGVNASQQLALTPHYAFLTNSGCRTLQNIVISTFVRCFCL